LMRPGKRGNKNHTLSVFVVCLGNANNIHVLDYHTCSVNKIKPGTNLVLI
jgi:hypothetical protein